MSRSGTSSASPRTVLLWTIVIASMANAALAAARLVVPIFALALGASVELVGITVALFTAIPTFFSVQFGRWVDRSGTFSPLVFSGVLIALGGVATIVLASKFMLLFTGALVGSGAIFAHIVATRAVGEIGIREDRGRNLGTLVMVYSITQFLGPTVSGSVYENFGMVAAMTIIALMGVMMITSLRLRLHNYRPRTDGGVRRQRKLRISELTTMPGLRKWLIVSSTLMAIFTIFPFTVALHAVEVKISATSAGLVLGAFSAGVFAARVTVPFFGSRIKPTWLVQISLLLGGCTYALLPFTDELATFAAAGAAIGLTLGMGGPLTLGLIYEYAPEARVNEAIGLSLAMSGFLQMSMPLLMGFVAAQVGMTPMVIGLAMCLAAMSIYVVRSRGP